MADEYQETLDYLYGRLNYERVGMPRSSAELRLGRMRRLMRRLGDPQHDLRVIHVAGTKGKGSTSTMLAAAIAATGVRVGLFTSPHLHRLEERFVVDGQEATAAEVVALTQAVRPVVTLMDVEAERDGQRGPTFFEVTTAMGLLHFRWKQAGAVVLEVGLGGRLDSTNVVRPLVSVITSISFDHTRQLGTTLRTIATEKAGILKHRRPAVSGVRGDEAREAIGQVARQRRVPLHQVDADFQFDPLPPPLPVAVPTRGHVHVCTWRTDWGTIELPLLGMHQAQNAAVTLATLDVLAENGLKVGRDAVVQGFAGLKFPARTEVLGDSPWLIVDGAHNVASAQALADTLQTCIPATRRTLVFGTTREKDMPGQLAALLPLFDTIVVTRYVDNARAIAPEEVAAAITALTGRVSHLAADPGSALETARRLTPRDGLICVTGSLFLAAETRALVLGHPRTPAPGRVVL